MWSKVGSVFPMVIWSEFQMDRPSLKFLLLTKYSRNFNLVKHQVTNYDLIDKPRFPAKRKKLCQWKCEKFTPGIDWNHFFKCFWYSSGLNQKQDGKRIREEMLNLSGTRRGDQNCPSHVNRQCSNRTCTKVACSTLHSFGLCEICASQMPLLCENIRYGRFVSEKRTKCKG